MMHPLMMDLLPLVRQGYCCSQLLVQLLVQAQGREIPDLVRALHGLCHGIGQSGGPCGLLTGGACVLALLAGKGAEGEEPHPMLAPLLNDYASWFYERTAAYGGHSCEQVALGLGDRKQSFRVSGKQIGVLFVLGLLYTSSSIFLFDAYEYIASGLATTLVFLYPVLVAIIMVFLKVVPSWPVWLAIAATFGGVLIMTQSDGSQTINPIGVLLSIASALVYALFIVIINRSKAIAGISNSLLTFYALMVGAIVFIGKILSSDTAITAGITTGADWLNLVGLALLPTIVSTATLAIASRNIGATKASVLGVFEPITAIIVGTLMFGEPLTTNIIVGISIAMVAVTFMITVTKR